MGEFEAQRHFLKWPCLEPEVLIRLYTVPQIIARWTEKLTFNTLHDQCRGEPKPAQRGFFSWQTPRMDFYLGLQCCRLLSSGSVCINNPFYLILGRTLMLSIWTVKDLRKPHPGDFEGSYCPEFPSSPQRKKGKNKINIKT